MLLTAHVALASLMLPSPALRMVSGRYQKHDSLDERGGLEMKLTHIARGDAVDSDALDGPLDGTALVAASQTQAVWEGCTDLGRQRLDQSYNSSFGDVVSHLWLWEVDPMLESSLNVSPCFAFLKGRRDFY